MQYRPSRKVGTMCRPSAWRAIRFCSSIALAAASWSCVAVKEVDSWTVSPDSPCSSLLAVFVVEQATLQSIIGPNFQPAEFGRQGTGHLQLSISSCADSIVSGRSDVGTGFALATVPITDDGMPVAITGLDDPRWSALVLFVGRSKGRLPRFMQDSSFAFVEGVSSLGQQIVKGGERMTARIDFPTGRMDISAEFACQPMPFQRGQVLVGTGVQSYSLLFGGSMGRECSTSTVSLQVTGDTPFGDLNLTADHATALRSSDVSWAYRALRNVQF